jgi:hypothetical protein
MHPESLPWQEYVYRLLEEEKIGVLEEDGHNTSFGLRIGHVSILDSAEKKNFADLRIIYIYIQIPLLRGYACDRTLNSY